MHFTDLCSNWHFPYIPTLSHLQGALRVWLLCFQKDALLHKFNLRLGLMLLYGAAWNHCRCHLGANCPLSHSLLADPHLSRMLQNVLWQEEQKR